MDALTRGDAAAAMRRVHDELIETRFAELEGWAHVLPSEVPSGE